MTIIKIERDQVLISLADGKEIWVPKAMLRQFGIKASAIKAGAFFPV